MTWREWIDEALDEVGPAMRHRAYALDLAYKRMQDAVQEYREEVEAFGALVGKDWPGVRVPYRPGRRLKGRERKP